MSDSNSPARIDVEVLLRYLVGQSSPEEAEAIQAWMRDSEQNRRTVTALARALPVPGALAEPPDEDAMWRRISARLRGDRARLALHRGEAVGAGRSVRAMPSSWRTSWVTAGAAAAVVCVAAGAWYLNLTSPSTTRGPTASREHAYVTRRGERATVRLPDGTHVLLDAESSLRFAGDFGAAARDVFLDGQAYFDVVHHDSLPFRVHAGRVVARDVGTQFVVRAYRGDSVTDVAVESGRVAVTRRSDSLVVTRGQVSRVTPAGPLVFARHASLESYLGWTHGQLVFLDTPLREAVDQIARWYDVEIRPTPDAIGEYPVTASFDDQPAPEVLRIVALSLNLQLSHVGHRFTLGTK
jgi:transmembrane sensor